jgi:DNA polymerase IV
MCPSATPLIELPGRPGAPRPRATPVVGAERQAPVIALVDLDSFYVSVERRHDPTLVGRPVVVGGLPGSRGVVACASYEARGHGVHAGMPISQATALLPARCPRCTKRQEAHANLALAGATASSASPHGTHGATLDSGCGRGCPVFLAGDHAAYLEASRQVMALLERFTPAVEPVSLDEAYLDFTGLERHHRSWLAAAETLRAAVLEATGLSISVGVGATRAVAKVAAALAKPAGILVVRHGEERAFLAALPLEHLPGIGPKTRAELERFQLRTVGDLAAVPTELLEATFGRLGPALARRARGLEDDVDPRSATSAARGTARVPGWREVKNRSISRETSFEKDTDDPRVVDGMLSYLAQRAAHALRAEGLKARSVGVRLRYADFETVESRQRLAQPTDLDHDILERVRALWPARWTRRVRLRLVGVVLHDLAPAGEQQLALEFAAPSSASASASASPTGATTDEESVAESRARLTPYGPSVVSPYVPPAVDRAVDRIRDRHGFGSVVRGRAIALLPTRRGRCRGGDADADTTGRISQMQLRWSARGLKLATPACSR